MDGLAIGKAVEEEAKKLWSDRTIVSVDKDVLDYKRRHESYHQETVRLFDPSHTVFYQAGLLFEDLFVISDFLVPDGH